MLKNFSQVSIKMLTSQIIAGETETIENAYDGLIKLNGDLITAEYSEETPDGTSDCELHIGRDNIVISSTGAVERKIELTLNSKGLCSMNLQGMSLSFDTYMSEYSLDVSDESISINVKLKYDLTIDNQILSQNALQIEIKENQTEI